MRSLNGRLDRIEQKLGESSDGRMRQETWVEVWDLVVKCYRPEYLPEFERAGPAPEQRLNVLCERYGLVLEDLLTQIDDVSDYLEKWEHNHDLFSKEKMWRFRAGQFDGLMWHEIEL